MKSYPRAHSGRGPPEEKQMSLFCLLLFSFERFTISEAAANWWPGRLVSVSTRAAEPVPNGFAAKKGPTGACLVSSAVTVARGV